MEPLQGLFIGRLFVRIPLEIEYGSSDIADILENEGRREIEVFWSAHFGALVRWIGELSSR